MDSFIDQAAVCRLLSTGDRTVREAVHILASRFHAAGLNAQWASRIPRDDFCLERLVQEVSKFRSGLRQITADQHSQLDWGQIGESELSFYLAYAARNAVRGSD